MAANSASRVADWVAGAMRTMYQSTPCGRATTSSPPPGSGEAELKRVRRAG